VWHYAYEGQMRKAIERLKAIKPEAKADLERLSYAVADNEFAQAFCETRRP
jgi:hypothetical protein